MRLSEIKWYSLLLVTKIHGNSTVIYWYHNTKRQYWYYHWQLIHGKISLIFLWGITHSISDHLIQFVILEDFITPKPLPKTNLYKRNFDKFDNNKLKEDLHKIDWINEILKNNDINEIFDIFYKTLSEIVDRHVPLTRVINKERTCSQNHG